MRLERHPGYWLLIGGPVPPGMAAITLGRLISVRADGAGDEQLLRHELVHVRQWRDLGVVGFSARYLGSYLRSRLGGHSHLDAYRRIPLEIEAFRASGGAVGAGEGEAANASVHGPGSGKCRRRRHHRGGLHPPDTKG